MNENLIPEIYTRHIAAMLQVDADLFRSLVADLTEEQRARARLREQRMAEARRELDALKSPLSRAILDLHKDEGGCQGCDAAGYDSWAPEWPCRTVLAVAKHHEIDLPEWT